MTDNSQGKRFASLEAIPRHAGRPAGLKGLLAMLYVRRTRTLSATAAVLACSVAVALVMPGLGSDTVTEHAAEAVPVAAVSESEPKAPIEAIPSAEVMLPSLPTIVGGAISSPAAVPAETPPVVDLPEPATPVSDPSGTVEASPAMPFYEAEETVARPVGSGVVAEPFFAAGLPSEEETLAFFGGTGSNPPQDSVTVEDPAPTIDLPLAAPSPVAKPTDDGTVDFRIVQGDGVQSGFVLFNKDDKNLRRYFVVVQAFREGAVIPWSFNDVADGKMVSTRKFAVEVTEEAFRGLSEEKRKFGKVVNAVLGSTQGEKEPVKWTVESNGNMLAAPEGKS